MKKNFPTIRDFDGRSYFKSEAGGILFGGFEPAAKPRGMRGIPDNFMYRELQEDWSQFEIFMVCGLRRFPDLEKAQIQNLLGNLRRFCECRRLDLRSAEQIHDRIDLLAGFDIGTIY